MTAPTLDVNAMGIMMRDLGARLATMTAVPLDGGETAIIYHYLAGRVAVNVKSETRNGAIPSIVPSTPAASRIEREIHDLYAVEFVGHPDLSRLIRPPALADGFFRHAQDERGAAAAMQDDRLDGGAATDSRGAGL